MHEAKHKVKVTNSLNMQSEFTALQVALHDLTNSVEQGFEQKRIFKLNNYIIKIV